MGGNYNDEMCSEYSLYWDAGVSTQLTDGFIKGKTMFKHP